MKDNYDDLTLPDFLRRTETKKVPVETLLAQAVPVAEKPVYERTLPVRKTKKMMERLRGLKWSKGSIYKMTVEEADRIIRAGEQAPPRSRARKRRKAKK